MALFGRRSGRGTAEAMLAANAAMAHLQEETQHFIAHAREVEDAVFDRSVAAQVVTVRQTVETTLGPGLFSPLERLAERRASDLHPLLFMSGFLMGLGLGLGLDSGLDGSGPDFALAASGLALGVGAGGAVLGGMGLRGCLCPQPARFLTLRLGNALFVGGALATVLAGTVLPFWLVGASLFGIIPTALWAQAFSPLKPRAYALLKNSRASTAPGTGPRPSRLSRGDAP